MSPLDRPLRLVAVLGSVQSSSNTARVVDVVREYLQERDNVIFDVIDPTGLDLRLPGLGSTADARSIQATIKEADGVILTTPEYHGSYSSTIKLIIDNLGFPSALKGKPVALLGVAGGRIGAIKALEHLRSVASHVGSIVLPGPVSVANVRTAFDEDGVLSDAELKGQIQSVADRLIDFINDHIYPAIALEALVRGKMVPEDLLP